MDRKFLRGDIQVEPLLDRWYAWTHLVPPATASRNLTERCMRIMQSYISAPLVHASAVKNPKMLGGPFIDHDGARVGEIEALLAETVTARAQLLQLSRALEELDEMLRTMAGGHSLQSLYPKTPELLRGYVELTYDLNSHPSFRVIEPLLYRSSFHQPDRQSIMLSITDGDDRPFILSTPRLPGPGLLELELPFAADSLDALFAAKRTPRQPQELSELCAVPETSRQQFLEFFTSEPPRQYPRYEGNGVRWRYFGHACILLETRSTTLLFDPVLSYTYEADISRYTYADLPDFIDYVLITHNHQDHVLIETLLQIRHKTGCIVVPRNGAGSFADPSLKLTLEAIGFRNVIEMSEFQMVGFESGSITALPFLGEHGDLNILSKLAYVVELKGHRLMFAADSCNIEPALYRHIKDAVGDVRALFVGMECDGAPGSWIYGPLHTRRLERSHDESRRLNGSNYDQAIEIVNALGCREIFVYAMGQEPWLNHVMSLKYGPDSNPIVQSNKLLKECRSRGLLAERLFGEREMLLD